MREFLVYRSPMIVSGGRTFPPVVNMRIHTNLKAVT